MASSDTPPMRAADQRLLEVAKTLPGSRILGMSVGRAQGLRALAEERSDAQIHCWYLDAYQANLARDIDSVPSNLSIECSVDWPDQPADLVLLPLSMHGETELARDLLQGAYHRLDLGGTLVASVDNPRDRWLHDQLKQWEKSVKVRTFDDASVYFVQKKAELKKLKDFSCELVYRDLDALIKLVTRPGVFSHRQIDAGARQLIDAVDVFPDADLIDIGCGSGAVALALAMRDPSARVHAVDSNARAVWCVQEGARRNHLENLTVELNPTGDYGQPNRFDMALANPPYYSDFEIAERFIQSALECLRPGGRLVLVTKHPKWYEEHLHEWFDDVEVFPSRRYHIASGVKPGKEKGEEENREMQI